MAAELSVWQQSSVCGSRAPCVAAELRVWLQSCLLAAAELRVYLQSSVCGTGLYVAIRSFRALCAAAEMCVAQRSVRVAELCVRLKSCVCDCRAVGIWLQSCVCMTKELCACGCRAQCAAAEMCV